MGELTDHLQAQPNMLPTAGRLVHSLCLMLTLQTVGLMLFLQAV